jgi:hypothetical protein
MVVPSYWDSNVSCRFDVPVTCPSFVRLFLTRLSREGEKVRSKGLVLDMAWPVHVQRCHGATVHLHQHAGTETCAVDLRHHDSKSTGFAVDG